MRQAALLMAFIFIVLSSFAQKKVIVQGTYPNLYVRHKVVSGETFYSISKMYNLATAQVNQSGSSVSLSIGAIVNIPLDKNNFTQEGQVGEDELLVPVHYIVAKGETLFRISQNFGKIRIDFLREWNDMNNDYIQQGQKIIIGHLKVDKRKVADILDRTYYDGKDEGAGNTAPAKVETPKKEEPKTSTNSSNSTDDGEGYFVTQFPSTAGSSNFVVRTGDAGVFKSTSGWTDKKYYVLMNNITPGTIVRITTNNGRSICAKVLGGLPEMRENNNLTLRMSNAAASVLKISEKKVEVKITFYNN